MTNEGPAAPRPVTGIRALAEELMDLAARNPEALAARVARLGVREQAELALRLPAEDRLRLLLHAPKPMRLVRSIPDAELYLTVRDVGPADAMPLLALASADQLHHLIDLESWRGDRFDADRCGAWVALLQEAGEATLRRFLRTADDELLVLLLQRWVRLDEMQFDDMPDAGGHGQSETGDEEGHVTPDGNHRFRPERDEHAPAIARMLRMLFVEQPQRYLRLLSAATWTLPAEAEEEALRWRASRLEEHGYPDPDEARTIYAPAAPDRGSAAGPASGASPSAVLPIDVPDAGGDAEADAPVPSARVALRLPIEAGLLAPALERLDPEACERALAETVALANRILVADGLDTGDREAHRAALAKAAGYLQIAFDARRATDASAAAAALARRPVLELFREGHDRVVALQERARRWFVRGWPGGDLDALRRLDPPVRQRVAGLLDTPPRFHVVDEIDRTEEFRPFRGLEELQEAGVALEAATFLGDLFRDRFGLPDAPAGTGEPPRLSTLFLTLFARHALGEPAELSPLSPPRPAASSARSPPAAPRRPGRRRRR